MTGVQVNLTTPSKKSSERVLTLKHLSAVPKRNLHDYLSTYIRDQDRFTEAYVQNHRNEGCLPEDDGNGPANILPFASTSNQASRDLLFGTPILKARVSTSHKQKEQRYKDYDDGGSNKTERCKSATGNNTGREGALESSNKKRPASRVRDDNRSTAKDVTSQKNIQVRDDEQVKRLEERRQRKRARKESMLPTKKCTDSDNSSTPEINRATTKKNRTKKHHSKNTQVGFALMHGFSATNVGKNRLTMKPLSRNFGVFTKGKASTKTRIDGKKQDADPLHHFSEDRFLNSKSPKPKLVSADSNTSCTISSHPAVKSSRSRLVSHRKASKQTPGNALTNTHEIQSVRRYSPNDSIVWDIENDSEAMSRPDSDAMQETILVKYSHGLTESANQATPKKTVSDVSNKAFGPSGETTGRSDPPISPATERSSLGPSESASQVKVFSRNILEPSRNSQHQQTIKSPNYHSKYFQCPDPSANYTSISFKSGLSILQSSETRDTNSFDCLVPVSEQQTTNDLDAYSSKDTVEDYDLQKALHDDLHVTVTTQSVPLDPLTSQTDLSWSPSCVYVYPAELDLEGSEDFQEQIVDSTVLQPCPPVVCDSVRDFTTQDVVSMDNGDDMFGFPPGVDVSPNLGRHCSNENSDTAVECLDWSGYHLLDFSSHGVDHESISNDYYRSCHHSGDRIFANVERTYNHTPSCSDDHYPENTNTYRSSSPAPDQQDPAIYNFRQGCNLLYYYDISPTKPTQPTQLSNVEAEVAGALRLGHWLPQRL